MIDVDSIPKLKQGVKFRFDKSRDAWILLAPERLFMPDEIAVEVLKRVDGFRNVTAIVDDLAAVFNAPRDEIESDVLGMLEDLNRKGAIGT